MTEVMEEPGTQTPEEAPEGPAEPTTEPGEPEPEEEPTPEEPPAPAAPEGMSERELEAVRVKLERSATTWRNRVADLMGDEANFLVACELCDPIIPGFHFPPEV